MSAIIGNDVEKSHIDEVEKRDLSASSVDETDHHMTRKVLWKLDTRLVFLSPVSLRKTPLLSCTVSSYSAVVIANRDTLAVPET